MDDSLIIEEVETACDQLRDWYDEGRVIPGYKLHHGKLLFAQILGISDTQTPGVTWYEHFYKEYSKLNSDLCRGITGPHGWAILQAAIIRMQEHENANHK